MTDEDEMISLKEFMKMNLPKPEWIIDGILPKGKLYLLGGARRSFKSWLALIWFYYISTGKPFLGHKVEQCNCLYLDGENSRYEDLRRLKFISNNEQIPDGSDIWCYPPIKLDNIRDIIKLENDIKRLNIKVIFIDVIRRFFDGKENDAGDVSTLLNDRLKREIVEKYGVTVVFLHHTKKPLADMDDVDYLDLLRASSEMANVPDAVSIIFRDGLSNVANLKTFKTKYSREPGDIIIQFDFKDAIEKLNIKSTTLGILGLNKYGDILQKIAEWIGTLPKDKTKFTTGEVKQMFKSIGMSVSDTGVDNALDKLADVFGVIEHTSHGHWKKSTRVMF